MRTRGCSKVWSCFVARLVKGETSLVPGRGKIETREGSPTEKKEEDT